MHLAVIVRHHKQNRRLFNLIFPKLLRIFKQQPIKPELEHIFIQRRVRPPLVFMVPAGFIIKNHQSFGFFIDHDMVDFPSYRHARHANNPWIFTHHYFFRRKIHFRPPLADNSPKPFERRRQNHRPAFAQSLRCLGGQIFFLKFGKEKLHRFRVREPPNCHCFERRVN